MTHVLWVRRCFRKSFWPKRVFWFQTWRDIGPFKTWNEGYFNIKHKDMVTWPKMSIHNLTKMAHCLRYIQRVRFNTNLWCFRNLFFLLILLINPIFNFFCFDFNLWIQFQVSRQVALESTRLQMRGRHIWIWFAI